MLVAADLICAFSSWAVARRRVMRLCPFVVMLALSLSTIDQAEAEVIYEFTGTLPTTGLVGGHTGIAAGESWTVRVEIDTTVEDGEASPVIGNYANAVVSAQVSFSGGYSRTFSFVDPIGDVRDIVVHDDYFMAGSTYQDMVSTDVRDGTVYGLLRVYAMDFGTAPVPALSSDALPLSPTAFSAAPDPVTEIGGEPVFLFADDFGRISYGSDVANNVTFAAVPEPSSIALWSLVGLLGLLLCRRR